MLLERFVRKDTGGAYLREISAELIFQDAIFTSSEIDPVSRCKSIKVMSACVVFVKTDATVALYAPVHFVINERSQVLIPVRAFMVPEFSVGMAGHYGHVLKMTGATFITDGTVVRVIGHQPADNILPEFVRLGIGYGNSLAVCHTFHAGHNKPAMLIFRIPV
jgi:hypothetical protein